MKLAAYLSDNKIARTDCAEQLEITPGWVTGLCDGSKSPSMDLAERIAIWTKGAVMPNDFMKSRRAASLAAA